MFLVSAGGSAEEQSVHFLGRFRRVCEHIHVSTEREPLVTHPKHSKFQFVKVHRAVWVNH